MRSLGILGAIAAALAAQLTLARFAGPGVREVDLVLVLVTFVGLRLGPLPGLATGTVAGLMQDTLSFSLVGVGGLAKSIVGFGAGLTGQQFIVAHTLTRFFVFWLATIVQAACVLTIYRVLEPSMLQPPYREILVQSIGNGVVGVLVFKAVEWLPGLPDRWRTRRRGRRRW